MYNRLKTAIEMVWENIYQALGQELLSRPIMEDDSLLYFGNIKNFLESIKREELRRAENSELCKVLNVRSLLELLEEMSTTENEKTMLSSYVSKEIETYLLVKNPRGEA